MVRRLVASACGFGAFGLPVRPASVTVQLQYSLHVYTVARALVLLRPARPQVRHEMMMLKTDAMPPWK